MCREGEPIDIYIAKAIKDATKVSSDIAPKFTMLSDRNCRLDTERLEQNIDHRVRASSYLIFQINAT